MPTVESVTTVEFDVGNAHAVMPAVRPDGDLYIVHSVSDDRHDFQVPTGWNSLHSFGNPALNTMWTVVGWRIGDSEPASYNFTGVDVAEAEGGAAVIRISGFDDANPINDSDFNTADSGTSVIAPSVTTTEDGCLIVRLFGSDGEAYTAIPATQIFHIPTGTFSSSPMAGSTQDQTTAGATGTSTATIAASDNWSGITVAVAPAAGGAPQSENVVLVAESEAAGVVASVQDAQIIPVRYVGRV